MKHSSTTAQLGPSSPGISQIVITHIYPIDSPQMLRDLGNRAFKCLIKKAFCSRETGWLLAATPASSKEDEWAQKNIHL